jgi:MFS family permease
MLVQAGAISLTALGTTFPVWAAAAVLLGAGTAMVYPTLLAAIGDVAHPTWRARSVGVYRLWRDGGFAVGALLAGVIADAFGILAAIWVVAALTAVSGLVVAIRMYETHPPRRCRGERGWRPVRASRRFPPTPRSLPRRSRRQVCRPGPCSARESPN